MKTLTLTSLLAFTLPLAAAAPALAQGTEAQRAACSGDAFRLCASSMPNADKVAICLHREMAQLSPACRSVFEGTDGGSQNKNTAAAKSEPAPAPKDAAATPPPAESTPASKEAAKDKAAEPAAPPPPAVAQSGSPPDPKAPVPATRAAAKRPASMKAAANRKPETRTIVRYVYVARPSSKRSVSQQAAARPHPVQNRRVASDMAQARYWMKRVTGISIGNLAGLTP